MVADGEGMRVLVVGASSGIGRATALALHDRGARVVAAARRIERLHDLGVERGVRCDVRRARDCADVVGAAVDALGGLDALVYVTGITMVRPILDADEAHWHEMLSTNLIGAALITRAALPHLLSGESEGRALYVSSDSARKPYPGLVAYGASKAALETFAEGLANEYPILRATHLMVGPTDDTEMGSDWDFAAVADWVERWLAEGYIRYATQKSPAVAERIVELLCDDDPPRAAEAVNPDFDASTFPTAP